MIAGAAPSVMVQSIHALIDFIYLAQRQVHLESSIRHMENQLSEFHTTKDVILNAGGHGGKDHFNILKLELMLSFVGAVRRNGSLMQYSADVSEQLLITHCKTPFTQTNRQSDFTEQIVHLLDHQECMCLMDVYLLLSNHKEPLVNAAAEEEELLSSTNPTSAWISHVAPSEHHHFNVLSPFTLPQGLWNTSHVLELFNKVVVWHKFHIQQYSTFGPSVILPSQVVQALPPPPDFLLGNCDTVLLNTQEQSLHNHGYHVVEVQTPLLYVWPFNIVTMPEDQPDIGFGACIWGESEPYGNSSNFTASLHQEFN
ncbi:hypothetical protein EDD16DRAFT_1521945 [Pisolithus croceorrhizus]|nr:hypothetical protein EDD16DRAFT_1521945 [Pisolithus croceorrhizus]KAI6119279.1 hypothetical protein EV401DRAFT_1888266 [Pisolithus croceorrhizus]KAI6165116.1 hypothetical protein EDD17DRAFT_1506000 [Pisolithus thermaeus]